MGRRNRCSNRSSKFYSFRFSLFLSFREDTSPLHLVEEIVGREIIEDHRGIYRKVGLNICIYSQCYADAAYGTSRRFWDKLLLRSFDSLR